MHVPGDGDYPIHPTEGPPFQSPVGGALDSGKVGPQGNQFVSSKHLSRHAGAASGKLAQHQSPWAMEVHQIRPRLLQSSGQPLQADRIQFAEGRKSDHLTIRLAKKVDQGSLRAEDSLPDLGPQSPGEGGQMMLSSGGPGGGNDVCDTH
jgi:hypothetical protein